MRLVWANSKFLGQNHPRGNRIGVYNMHLYFKFLIYVKKVKKFEKIDKIIGKKNILRLCTLVYVQIREHKTIDSPKEFQFFFHLTF